MHKQLSPEEVRKMAIDFAYRMGFGRFAEDLAQDVLLKKFGEKKGQKQLIKFAVRDAVRAWLGRPGSKKAGFILASVISYMPTHELSVDLPAEIEIPESAEPIKRGAVSVSDIEAGIRENNSYWLKKFSFQKDSA